MKSKISVLFLLTVLSTNLFSNEDKPVMEMTMDLGCGFYVGSFYNHLKDDGAYTVTPTLDLYFSSYISSWLGIQFQIGNGSVIHPSSEPIEGVINYMGIGPFFKRDMGEFYLKGWVDAGFQQPTMSLEWYGSGFIEAGANIGFDLSAANSISIGLKYRTQFLQSIIIYSKYDSIDKNDNLSSITPSVGWVVRW